MRIVVEINVTSKNQQLIIANRIHMFDVIVGVGSKEV